MDVDKPRGRIISILNDSDCPSFAVRPRSSTLPSSPTSPPKRPPLCRQAGYPPRPPPTTFQASPPLVRNDSTASSKSSDSSMDSSPSPLTPACNFVDPGVAPFDHLLRQDAVAYLQSPPGTTPFMEQQLALIPAIPEQLMQYPTKTAMPSLPPSAYPLALAPADLQQLPTPSSSAHSSVSSSNVAGSASVPASQHCASAQPAPPKKNKYPCPYAATHSCPATFTTSGHAARHGKKHTGEKGVHCPVCNKAFTRKDNMKQHERTHRGSISSSNSDESMARKSKAAATMDALKAQKVNTASQSAVSRRNSSIIHSPLSEVTSLAPSVTSTPLTSLADPGPFEDPNASMVTDPDQIHPMGNVYPRIDDESFLGTVDIPREHDHKAIPTQNTVPPPLPRGFSDLDTLAQAAESFSPYYS